MESWHKLLKSKQCYFLNVTLLWIKLWRWRCTRYLCNHGFLLCVKSQCLKFMYIEIIHKKLFLSFLEMHNCVWYLWTCPYINFHDQLTLHCTYIIMLTKHHWKLKYFHILWGNVFPLFPLCFSAGTYNLLTVFLDKKNKKNWVKVSENSNITRFLKLRIKAKEKNVTNTSL